VAFGHGHPLVYIYNFISSLCPGSHGYLNQFLVKIQLFNAYYGTSVGTGSPKG
jgi:hypothetical protein